MPEAQNVLGTKLEPCCKFPMTGFYRDGYCRTGPDDLGRHVVCIKVTKDFLAFSKETGNDLSTPQPEMDFSGLIPGDQWCLCALRWQDAFEADAAPEVILSSTHESALEIVRLEDLKNYAVEKKEGI
ncbi:MAG TPA: DUF2237 domain-containing protein [Candidatus Omnitrophota bacterium]|nr:DUF2237 domain-containing protein [Candidatus Omnitrophota bacterium]